ncbi:MAG: HD domain-containing protein [bacterium]|nr:HD domain-containing protein [bacterium]
MNTEKLYKKPFFPLLRDLALKTNIQLYLVGGCIRDYLLKRPCNDYDFAIKGDAIAFAQQVSMVMGGSFVLLDEAKVSARVVLKSKKQLINLDFNNLKAEDILADLKRRDFTINAIALDLIAKDTEFIDPLNGLKDIKAGFIRVISNSIFQDDPLRMLRAIRLSSELGFEIEKGSWEAIVRLKGLISDVSVERVTNEIYLTLAAKNSNHFITQLDKAGLLEEIIPEIISLKGLEQDTYHHLPVWEHSLSTLTQLEGIVSNLDRLFPPWHLRIKRYLNQPIGGNHIRLDNLKISCLLHDIGKSGTMTQEPSGRIRFIEHELLGAKIASKIAKRLKLSTKEKKMIELVVKSHMRPGHLVQIPILTDKVLHKFFRDLDEEVISTLLLSLADRYATIGPKVPPENLHKHYQTISLIIDRFYSPTPTIIPPKILKGGEIMKHFGLESGPIIGKLLSAIEEAFVDKKITNKKEALKFIADLLEKSEK